MAITPKIRRVYKGGATPTTITTTITNTTDAVSITAATGWPTVGPFYAVIDPGLSTEEKIYVGAISGTALSSITRGVDDTSGVGHSSGATIYPVFTAVDADEANQLTASYTTKGGIVYMGDPSFTQLAIGSTTGHALKVSASGVPEWGEIATAGLADSSVTSAKIVDATIVAGDLASNAVTTAKILDANVTTGKLADASVTSPKLAAPTLTAKTDTFTLALVDANCTIQCNKATAMDVEVPGSGIAFANGTVITLVNYGAGQVTVKPLAGSSVDIRSSNGFKLRTQYSMASLVKISDTEWVLSGDTVTA
jgi:hypothetical protein